MSASEYQDLARQLDRIERLLAKLAGVGPDDATHSLDMTHTEPPPPITPQMSERQRIEAVQAEGRYVFDTQGLAAYQQFWKLQAKNRRQKLIKTA